MRNKEGYKDPTAGAAITNVRRREKKQRKKEAQRERKDLEMGAGATKTTPAASDDE